MLKWARKLLEETKCDDSVVKFDSFDTWAQLEPAGLAALYLHKSEDEIVELHEAELREVVNKAITADMPKYTHGVSKSWEVIGKSLIWTFLPGYVIQYKVGDKPYCCLVEGMRAQAIVGDKALSMSAGFNRMKAKFFKEKPVALITDQTGVSTINDVQADASGSEAPEGSGTVLPTFTQRYKSHLSVGLLMVVVIVGVFHMISSPSHSTTKLGNADIDAIIAEYQTDKALGKLPTKEFAGKGLLLAPMRNKANDLVYSISVDANGLIGCKLDDQSIIDRTAELVVGKPTTISGTVLLTSDAPDMRYLVLEQNCKFSQ